MIGAAVESCASRLSFHAHPSLDQEENSGAILRDIEIPEFALGWFCPGFCDVSFALIARDRLSARLVPIESRVICS